MNVREITMVEALPTATRTATANGSAVNLVDYDGDVALTLMTAAGTGTSPTLDVKVQDSADGSSGWADVSGATFTQVTDAADAHETIYVDADNVKQYIRLVPTIAGTSPSFACGVNMAGKKIQR